MRWLIWIWHIWEVCEVKAVGEDFYCSGCHRYWGHGAWEEPKWKF